MAEDVEFNLVELFWAAQGEGPHVGRPTAFLRFGGCDLRCGWCDSPATWQPAKTFRFERMAGSADFDQLPNPVSSGQVDQVLAALRPVREASRLGRERGMAITLETHGLACDAMARVAEAVDYVSMDWKLEDDVRPAKDASREKKYSAGFADLHREFLGLLAEREIESSVKLVVTTNTRDSDLDMICRAVASIAPRTPLVLQPVTPMGAVKEQPSAEVLLRHLRFCQERVEDVRLIPQTHRVYGAL